MAGFYAHLSDKELSLKIKKFEQKLNDPSKTQKQTYVKRIKFLEKEKSKRLSKATMTIQNLIN